MVGGREIRLLAQLSSPQYVKSDEGLRCGLLPKIPHKPTADVLNCRKLGPGNRLQRMNKTVGHTTRQRIARGFAPHLPAIVRSVTGYQGPGMPVIRAGLAWGGGSGVQVKGCRGCSIVGGAQSADRAGQSRTANRIGLPALDLRGADMDLGHWLAAPSCGRPIQGDSTAVVRFRLDTPDRKLRNRGEDVRVVGLAALSGKVAKHVISQAVDPEPVGVWARASYPQLPRDVLRMSCWTRQVTCSNSSLASGQYQTPRNHVRVPDRTVTNDIIVQLADAAAVGDIYVKAVTSQNLGRRMERRHAECARTAKPDVANNADFPLGTHHRQ
ncbi:hypothetical protein EGW08_001590 [Elysia chlorotica]|uniref:Uncharacterized protein n=1 Tax=Elysia chlorotica TaxID=188477 RepID=A0A3S1CES0_ELYCH|nr:hypothetical protein EGW08_001590 [Elysia chlorotica]